MTRYEWCQRGCGVLVSGKEKCLEHSRDPRDRADYERLNLMAREALENE